MKVLVADGAALQPTDGGTAPIDYAAGRHERAFLEPEHVPHDETMALLKGYIVAATGKPPIEFAGTLNKSTTGDGRAGGELAVRPYGHARLDSHATDSLD